MTAIATRPATKTARQQRREHEKVADFLSVVESKATDAAEILTSLYEDNESVFALLDDEERDALSSAANKLHDLVTAAEHLQHYRRMAASRTTWTAQDWQQWDLVSRNID